MWREKGLEAASGLLSVGRSSACDKGDVVFTLVLVLVLVLGSTLRTSRRSS